MSTIFNPQKLFELFNTRCVCQYSSFQMQLSCEESCGGLNHTSVDIQSSDNLILREIHIAFSMRSSETSLKYGVLVNRSKV